MGHDRYCYFILYCCLLLIPLSHAYNYKAEINYYQSKGDNEVRNIGIDGEYRKPVKQFEFEIHGKAYQSRSQQQITSENYFLSEKINYQIPEDSYLFEIISWEKDKFIGLDSRNTFGLGYGYNFLDLGPFRGIFEIGGEINGEDRISQRYERFGSVRTYEKIEYANKPLTLYEWVELIKDFESSQGWRFNFEVGAIFIYSESLSLKLSHLLKWDNDPILKHRTNKFTNLSLVFRY